jgi:hypothetical protein
MYSKKYREMAVAYPQVLISQRTLMQTGSFANTTAFVSAQTLHMNIDQTLHMKIEGSN